MLTHIAGITLPIYVLVAVGFFYSQRFKPDLNGSNKLVVDVALPVLIFTSLSAKSFDPIAALTFTGASVALILVSGLLAWPLVKWSGSSRQAFLPCAMFTNVGPVGIPLIVLAYGPSGMPTAVVLLVISNILHFTLGNSLMSGRIHWRMLYANHLVWATALGVCSSQLNWTFPDWLHTSLNLIGSVLVPMMLLSLGSRLAESRVTDAWVGVRATVLIAGVRLAAAYLILRVLPLQGVERGSLILFACMPAAVFNFMLADRFNVQPHRVASMVVVGHFLGMVLLPLGLMLALNATALR